MDNNICFVEDIDELIDVAGKCRGKNYIYGVGKYGEYCATLFDKLNIAYTGFIVTRKSSEVFHKHYVFNSVEILGELTEDDNVFLAMKKEYQDEVIPQFTKNSFARTLVIDEKLSKQLHRKTFEEFIKEISDKYPKAVYKSSRKPNDILVIRLDRLGDMIWTSALFRELRNNYPEAKITAIVGSKNIALLECCPYVDKIVGYSYSKEEEYGMLSYQELFKHVENFCMENFKNAIFDIAFVPRGLLYDNFIINTFFAVLTSKIRVGNWMETTDRVDCKARSVFEKIYNVISEHSKPAHEVEKILGMLKAINCRVEHDYTEVWYTEKRTSIGLSDSEFKHIRKKYRYLVAVGLTSQERRKTWDGKFYRRLFDEISSDFSIIFILLGDSNASSYALDSLDDKCCLDLTGKTNLHGVMKVIDNCDMYIGANTGLIHIAAAFGKPVVELSAHLPWGYDDLSMGPKHCGAWRTNYTVVYPETAASRDCAEAGYCIHDEPHCINMINFDYVKSLIRNYLLYYKLC